MKIFQVLKLVLIAEVLAIVYHGRYLRALMKLVVPTGLRVYLGPFYFRFTNLWIGRLYFP